jgi:hypothetical protein
MNVTKRSEPKSLLEGLRREGSPTSDLTRLAISWPFIFLVDSSRVNRGVRLLLSAFIRLIPENFIRRTA